VYDFQLEVTLPQFALHSPGSPFPSIPLSLEPFFSSAVGENGECQRVHGQSPVLLFQAALSFFHRVPARLWIKVQLANDFVSGRRRNSSQKRFSSRHHSPSFFFSFTPLPSPEQTQQSPFPPSCCCFELSLVMRRDFQSWRRFCFLFPFVPLTVSPLKAIFWYF